MGQKISLAEIFSVEKAHLYFKKSQPNCLHLSNRGAILFFDPSKMPYPTATMSRDSLGLHYFKVNALQVC